MYIQWCAQICAVRLFLLGNFKHLLVGPQCCIVNVQIITEQLPDVANDLHNTIQRLVFRYMSINLLRFKKHNNFYISYNALYRLLTAMKNQSVT